MGKWFLTFSIISCFILSRQTKATTCNDGWVSSSTGRGTCSHHGGIKNYSDTRFLTYQPKALESQESSVLNYSNGIIIIYNNKTFDGVSFDKGFKNGLNLCSYQNINKTSIPYNYLNNPLDYVTLTTYETCIHNLHNYLITSGKTEQRTKELITSIINYCEEIPYELKSYSKFSLTMQSAIVCKLP